MDNKVQETIGDVYCPTCRNEKSVYLSTNKTTSFYDCKKCKACCNALNITFMDQKPTTMLFGGDGTHCFAKKTSRDYEKEKPSPCLKNFLRQSQPSRSKLEPKETKIIPFMVYSCRHPIGWYSYPKLHLHYHFLHFQSILKHHNFLSFQRRFRVVSWFWTRFSDSDCERCRPRNDNELPRVSSGSLELVVVSRTTVFEQPSNASSSYAQPSRNTWNEGRSTFKCRCRKNLGQKRVSGVCCWYGQCWILLGKWSAGLRRWF